MISSLDEFHAARDVVHESLDLLAKQGIEHHEQPRLGMMVELPAVADLIDDFAREADFLSLGTNDLIQFLLAVDRTNESVADFYLPHHPSVLRVLGRIARSAQANDCELSICGDMAHQPQYIPFLLGIGVRVFSVDPVYLLRTQQTIMATALPDAETLAAAMLAQSRIRDIESLLQTSGLSPRPSETPA
jgi:phosphotransferase system enzyme I (PtsP)